VTTKDAPEVTAQAEPAADVEPVLAVIQHEVRPDAVERYEAWLARIMPVAADFAGHRGVHVIRPGPTGRRRYTVTVRFASVGFARAWFESATRRALMREAEPLLARDEAIHTLAGLELWFERRPGTPARWKQFAVTAATIYPLTLLVPAALQAALASLGLALPPLLQQLLVAVGIVAAMTWVVMPSVVRALSGWLHRGE
jgi:antibiotic biosynthesis monooxygenase (ABM) superfamily enzyme